MLAHTAPQHTRMAALAPCTCACSHTPACAHPAHAPAHTHLLRVPCTCVCSGTPACAHPAHAPAHAHLLTCTLHMRMLTHLLAHTLHMRVLTHSCSRAPCTCVCSLTPACVHPAHACAHAHLLTYTLHMRVLTRTCLRARRRAGASWTSIPPSGPTRRAPACARSWPRTAAATAERT